MVLNILGFLAVITNASMIAFVGSQEAARFGLIASDNCEMGVWSIEQMCTYAADGGARLLSQRVDNWQLWAMFFAIEHGMMLLRVWILIMTPSMPTWVRSAKETLEFRMVRALLVHQTHALHQPVSCDCIRQLCTSA